MDDVERHRQAMKIFDDIRDQPVDKINSLIKIACHGNDQLCDEVDSLIEHHERIGDFIEEPAAESITNTPNNVSDSQSSPVTVIK